MSRATGALSAPNDSVVLHDDPAIAHAKSTLSGSWSGTVLFEHSDDGGWTADGSRTTNGTFAFPVTPPKKDRRTRAGDDFSGSASVSMGSQ